MDNEFDEDEDRDHLNQEADDGRASDERNVETSARPMWSLDRAAPAALNVGIVVAGRATRRCTPCTPCTPRPPPLSSENRRVQEFSGNADGNPLALAPEGPARPYEALTASPGECYLKRNPTQAQRNRRHVQGTSGPLLQRRPDPFAWFFVPLFLKRHTRLTPSQGYLRQRAGKRS